MLDFYMDGEVQKHRTQLNLGKSRDSRLFIDIRHDGDTLFIMPRTARIVLPEIPLHTMQRGNNRQDVFFLETFHPDS